MKIYLVRHGESAPTGADNERPLSKQGKEDIKRLANFIAPQHLSITYLFHSIKKRAIETAEILAPAFSFNSIAEISEELDPLYSVTPIANKINKLEKDALFVGHMPFMSSLVSQLLTGNTGSLLHFKTGTMVCLEKIGNQWVLNWMLIPELLIP